MSDRPDGGSIEDARALGRLEGRVEGLERRFGAMEVHIGALAEKVDSSGRDTQARLESIRESISRHDGFRGAWNAIITYALAGAGWATVLAMWVSHTGK